MQNGRESVCCRASPKSYDKIPPAMSCRQDEKNFTSVCKNPAVMETDFNQFFENEAGVRTYECNSALGCFFFRRGWVGGGGGREQTPCIDWCNPNGYDFRAILV